MKDETKFAKVKKYLLERKYGLLVLLWVVWVLWYFLWNKYGVNWHLMHIPIDDKIPFVEFFVVPYVLWYGYIAFCFLWTFFTSKRDFLAMCSLVFLAYFLSLVVITAYPTYHDLRPDPALVRDNVFTKLVFALYSTEEPRCIFPSMHCMGVIVMSVGLLCAESLKGKLWPKIFCPIYTVLVILSTVFIKQHSFADVLLAIPMSAVICVLTYFVIVPKRRFLKKAEPLAEGVDPVLSAPSEEEKPVSEECAPQEQASEDAVAEERGDAPAEKGTEE